MSKDILALYKAIGRRNAVIEGNISLAKTRTSADKQVEQPALPQPETATTKESTAQVPAAELPDGGHPEVLRFETYLKPEFNRGRIQDAAHQATYPITDSELDDYNTRMTGWLAVHGEGLRHSGGSRDEGHNAKVGGKPNSRHLFGDADDFVNNAWSTKEEYEAAAQGARDAGLWALVHDAGSGIHLHIQSDSNARRARAEGMHD